MRCIKDMTSDEKMQFIKILIIRKKGWGLSEKDAIILLSFLDSLSQEKK